jgi:hypothetical protein
MIYELELITLLGRAPVLRICFIIYVYRYRKISLERMGHRMQYVLLASISIGSRFDVSGLILRYISAADSRVVSLSSVILLTSLVSYRRTAHGNEREGVEN